MNNKRLFAGLLWLSFCWLSSGTARPPGAGHVMRPVHTFSIVARDPATGEMGVAVQSHWFSVGSVVPWAEAGVGAVATQSFVDPTYGKLGLDLMRAGRSAPETLTALLAGDEGRAVRQVAMVDSQGRVAAHTGKNCIAAAGNEVDTQRQFSAQANLMANATVWPAMAKAYRSAKGDLAARMLAALEAAQKAGGDIRGRQSAAIIVVSAKSSNRPWVDRRFDLQVEDSAHPIVELKRLVQRQRAYQHMNAGDLAVEHGDFELANREYSAAESLATDVVEIPFWAAVSRVNSGDLKGALPIFRKVFARERRWLQLVPRLVDAKLLPDDPATTRAILQAGDH